MTKVPAFLEFILMGEEPVKDTGEGEGKIHSTFLFSAEVFKLVLFFLAVGINA